MEWQELMHREYSTKFKNWILNQIFENEVIEQEWLGTFFGIEPPGSCQKWLQRTFGVEPPKAFREAKFYGQTNWPPLNNKQKNLLNKVITDMVDEELIREFRVKWHKDQPSELFGYMLTEKGFHLLRLQKIKQMKDIKFTDYLSRFYAWRDEYFNGYEGLKKDIEKIKEKYNALISWE